MGRKAKRAESFEGDETWVDAPQNPSRLRASGKRLVSPVAWILLDETIREIAQDTVRVTVLFGALQIVAYQLSHVDLHHTKAAFEIAHEVLALGNFSLLGGKSLLNIALRTAVRGG